MQSIIGCLNAPLFYVLWIFVYGIQDFLFQQIFVLQWQVHFEHIHNTNLTSISVIHVLTLLIETKFEELGFLGPVVGLAWIQGDN